MSGDAHGWTIRHSPYKNATFTVHCMIADTVNDMNSNEFWMSIGKLASKARIERATASRCVKTLTDEGFLELLEERPGGTNRYQFLFPEIPVVFETRPSAPKSKDLCSDDTPSDGGVCSDDTGGCVVTTHQVCCDDTGGVSREHTNKRELEDEPLSGTQEFFTGTVKKPSDPFDNDFEVWWKAYPRKYDKKSALLKYRARRRESKSSTRRDDLLRACKNYAKAMSSTEMEYIKHPATFLAPDGPWVEWLDGPPASWAPPRGPQKSAIAPMGKHTGKTGRISSSDRGDT